MKTLDLIANFVFLTLCILRLVYNIGSGNAGWSAVWGAITLLTGLLIASILWP